MGVSEGEELVLGDCEEVRVVGGVAVVLFSSGVGDTVKVGPTVTDGVEEIDTLLEPDKVPLGDTEKEMLVVPL